MTRPPGGGSLALIPVVLLAWIAAASWLDDLKGLAAGPRLAVQALAVAVLLAILERRARAATDRA